MLHVRHAVMNKTGTVVVLWVSHNSAYHKKEIFTFCNISESHSSAMISLNRAIANENSLLHMLKEPMFSMCLCCGKVSEGYFEHRVSIFLPWTNKTFLKKVL